jgi:hypothetical protein
VITDLLAGINPAQFTRDPRWSEGDGRLFDALVWATFHEDNHDQNVWGDRRGTGTECGTTLCIGGKALLTAGWAEFSHTGNLELTDVAAKLGLMSHAAQVLLELDEYWADKLFIDTDDVADCWAVAALATDGRVTPPAVLDAEIARRGGGWGWLTMVPEWDPDGDHPEWMNARHLQGRPDAEARR